jgi:hypothetical protein
MEPEVVPSAAGPMIRTALIILVCELALIGWVRWRNSAQARARQGGETTQHPATSV